MNENIVRRSISKLASLKNINDVLQILINNIENEVIFGNDDTKENCDYILGVILSRLEKSEISVLKLTDFNKEIFYTTINREYDEQRNNS